MGVEIERKFLLAGDGWRQAAVRRETFRQGYLPTGGELSLRVRIAGSRAWLNLKSGGLAARRLEFEYAIPLADAETILDSLAAPPLIEKTRHYVPVDGFEWEIDEFHGRNEGLIVAEIELEREDQPFPRPEWLGPEVTHLPRYYNVCLARHPYADWDEAERRA